VININTSSTPSQSPCWVLLREIEYTPHESDGKVKFSKENSILTQKNLRLLGKSHRDLLNRREFGKTPGGACIKSGAPKLSTTLPADDSEPWETGQDSDSDPWETDPS